MCTSKKNTLILKIGCQGDKRAKWKHWPLKINFYTFWMD
jgi:hypothetical protein